MDDAQREQFEAWARNAVPQFSGAGKYVRDGRWSYNHNIVELMWQCWIAARLRSTGELRDEPDAFEAWWGEYRHRNRELADYARKKQIAFDAWYARAKLSEEHTQISDASTPAVPEQGDAMGLGK